MGVEVKSGLVRLCKIHPPLFELTAAQPNFAKPISNISQMSKVENESELFTLLTFSYLVLTIAPLMVTQSS